MYLAIPLLAQDNLPVLPPDMVMMAVVLKKTGKKCVTGDCRKITDLRGLTGPSSVTPNGTRYHAVLALKGPTCHPKNDKIRNPR